jgi:hypothetical protein
MFNPNSNYFLLNSHEAISFDSNNKENEMITNLGSAPINYHQDIIISQINDGHPKLRTPVSSYIDTKTNTTIVCYAPYLDLSNNQGTINLNLIDQRESIKPLVEKVKIETENVNQSIKESNTSKESKKEAESILDNIKNIANNIFSLIGKTIDLTTNIENLKSLCEKIAKYSFVIPYSYGLLDAVKQLISKCISQG